MLVVLLVVATGCAGELPLGAGEDGLGGPECATEEQDPSEPVPSRSCQAPTGRYLSPTLKITLSGSTDPIYICGPDGVRLVYEKFLDPETCVYSGFVECHWCDGTWARTTFDLLVEEDGTLSGTVTNPVGTFSETWTPVRGAP